MALAAPPTEKDSSRPTSRMGSAADGYRPALDGIRAVAVLAVIGYHLGWSALPGGFLGVDVFFVLSGYLITGLLLREKDAHGRIRLSRFWARRARRLLPALLLLLAVSAVVTRMIAPAMTLAARRLDILSTLFYYANWHFISVRQSYFAAYTGVSPLRHAWSLAIEEQFYLVWPLLLLGLLLLARRRRRVLLGVITGGALLSAALMATRYEPGDPFRSYYGTDTRIHQLLIGATLAMLIRAYPGITTGRRAQRVARWAAALAAAAVVTAFLTVNDQSSLYYQGGAFLFAMAVGVGLWALEVRPDATTARVLSTLPARWIGRISYGAYLWHWPLLIWLATAQDPGVAREPVRQAVAIALTFAISTLSFHLVECPVRYGRVPWVRTSTLRLATAVIVSIVVVAAGAVHATKISGDPIASQVNDRSDSACPKGSVSFNEVYRVCSRTTPDSPASPVVAVVGDSTARALNPGMTQLAKRRGWRYVQAGQGGCSLVPVYLPVNTEPVEVARAQDRACAKFIPQILAEVQSIWNPDVWIASDTIAVTSPLLTADNRLLKPGDPERDRLVTRSIRSTVQRLTASGAWVVYLKTPPVGQPVECAMGKDGGKCTAPASIDDPKIVAFDQLVLGAIAGLPRVTYLSIDDILCPNGGRCPAVIDGVLARYDGKHFTGTFSHKIVPLIIARAEAVGVPFQRRVSSRTS